MKCPKCGYLGFETSDRCRNCGYDFSLSVPSATPPELPLQARDAGGGPLADLTLARPTGEPRPLSPTPALDLDRVIGAATADDPPTTTSTVLAADAPRSVAASPRHTGENATADQPDAGDGDRTGPPGLPLFSESGTDDTPLITSPRPARAPLAVRRATPDLPRGRSRTRVTPRRDAPPLDLDPQPMGGVEASGIVRTPLVDIPAAGLLPRVGAMLLDGLLLTAINAAVLYFTLAIAGLAVAEVRLLPPIPLAAFLLLLNGGYLVAFTAAGGQTIGKMITGIRVMGDDGRRVDVAGAVLRGTGCLLSIVTLGLGYLPVLFTADARALHDRIAGTRVVKN